jgi:hypothetical protein
MRVNIVESCLELNTLVTDKVDWFAGVDVYKPKMLSYVLLDSYNLGAVLRVKKPNFLNLLE